MSPSFALLPFAPVPSLDDSLMKFAVLSKLAAALATASLAAATIDNTAEAAELMGMAASMSGSYTLTSVGNGKSITEVRSALDIRPTRPVARRCWARSGGQSWTGAGRRPVKLEF